jgi:hypothetical protein
MATISPTSAENSSLFEIDQELEAAFEAASQEQEQTGEIGEESRERCLALFAELGKKVDRIAAYVRATEFKARAAKEEAARLSARQKSEPRASGQEHVGLLSADAVLEAFGRPVEHRAVTKEQPAFAATRPADPST